MKINTSNGDAYRFPKLLSRSSQISPCVAVGAPFSKRLTQKMGYVDLEVAALQSKLTVKEMLLYAARLRMPQATEELDRIVRMEHVIDSMDLQS